MKKIAIPMANGSLAMHFGHCENFALVDVDMDAKKIVNVAAIESPAHEPGLLPRFLAEQGANMIIAGGMGQRAQNLFTENGIEVLVGAPAETPEVLVDSLLSGELKAGSNMCDH